MTNEKRLIINSKSQKVYTNNPFGSLVSTCKRRKNTHNIDCDVSKEYLESLYIGQQHLCYYCNVEVDMRIGNKLCTQISLDRIDSNKGHIQTNVVITCLFCNYAKNNTHIDHFKNFINCLKTGKYIPEKTKKDPYWNRKLYNLANQRDPRTNITKEWVLNQLKLQNNKCYYSGMDFIIAENPRYLFKPSIERLDNNKSYTQDNCVLVCLGINYGRSCTSVELFKEHLANIRKIKVV
jgi:hypothetical protein